jgi:uncharacterized protein
MRLVRFFSHHWPDFIVLLAAMAAQLYAVRRIRPPRWLSGLILLLGCGLLLIGLMLRSVSFALMLPIRVADTLRTMSFLVLIVSLGAAVIAVVWHWLPRPEPQHSPERRRLLLAARGVMLASPVVVTGYGVFVQRDNFHLREIDVPIRGLSKELHGLRLVQISDIHLSPFLSEREFARAIDMANEAKADLALVTGDLITSYKDPLDACFRQLTRLRADAGVIGCLGNHEIYSGTEEYVQREGARRGMRFLRDRAEVLKFRGVPLNFVGVDYQNMSAEYLVNTERHVQPGMPNILLSHNPDVFPKAAAKGFDLTISGHTHGGQITFEVLHQNLSVARFYTPYVYGLYQEGNASVYVTRGLGTVGVPARLGAPPEVAVIRLCAI